MEVVNDDRLRETLAEMAMEASHEDLVEALGKEEFAALASKGRVIVQDALAKVDALTYRGD